MVTFFDPGSVVFAVEADARILKTAFSLPGYHGLRDCNSRIISDSCSPCTASPDGSFCMEEKRNALRTGDESGIPIFVPECREDGGYKQVQCHKGKNLTHKTEEPIHSRHWLLLVCHRGGEASARILCSTLKGFTLIISIIYNPD